MVTRNEHIIHTYGIAKNIVAGRVAWIDQRFIDSDSRAEHIHLEELRRHLVGVLESLDRAEENDPRLKPVVDNVSNNGKGTVHF